MTANTATPSVAEAKAALAAARKAEQAPAVALTRDVLKKLPEHTFKTGSTGRQFRGNLEVDGKRLMVTLMVVDRDSVVKEAKEDAPVAPVVSLVKKDKAATATVDPDVPTDDDLLDPPSAG